jgi:NTE family protein
MQEKYGFSANDVEVIVGTSAGSVLAALLSLGVTVPQLRQQYASEPVSAGPLAGYHFDPEAATGGHKPALPRTFSPGSPRLLSESIRHPGQIPTTAVLASLLPSGGRELTGIGELVAHAAAGRDWPHSPAAWVVAMDYASGRRVVFGRAGAPVASMPEAVMASCAIPGWFTPVTIGERTYVDGGTVSSTSVDALTHMGLDEVYVIAPMVTAAQERMPGVLRRLEQRWRSEVTKQARAECSALEATGTRVRMVGPGAEDLAAIGSNVMVSARRQAVLETSLRTSPAAWSDSVAG